MVEVFKTNVDGTEQSVKVLTHIEASFPELIINFDLEDCDKILRTEGAIIPIDQIKKLLRVEGYFCEVLV